MNDPQGQESQRHGIQGWIAAHPKTTTTLCLFLLLIGATVLFDQAAKGRVARRIAALRAAGMPTTIEDLQAAMPDIPEDENMTIPIVEQAKVLDAIKIKITEIARLRLAYVGSAMMVPSGRRRLSAELDAARSYLDQAAPALAIIHEALKLECGWLDIQWKTPAIMPSLPELSQIHRVAQTLALESMVAAEDGDTQRTGEILLSFCRLERSLDGSTFLVGALVRTAINTLAYDQIERAINLYDLSDTSLQRLQTELRGQEGNDYYKRAMIGERVMFMNTMQWIRSAPPSGTSRITGSFSTPSGITIPTSSIWNLLPILTSLDEAAGIAVYDDLILATENPDADCIERLKKAERKVATLPAYDFMTRRLLRSFSYSAEYWVRSVALNRALQTAITCERFRLATGAWPATLDALVPDYLAAVPSDPFDGEPLRYAHIDEGIKIWTIAKDLVDDGGDIGRLTVRRYPNQPKDQGWVLLNPDLRGRPAETDDD